MELWMHGAFAISALIAFAVAVAPGREGAPDARATRHGPADRRKQGRDI